MTNDLTAVRYFVYGSAKEYHGDWGIKHHSQGLRDVLLQDVCRRIKRDVDEELPTLAADGDFLYEGIDGLSFLIGVFPSTDRNGRDAFICVGIALDDLVRRPARSSDAAEAWRSFGSAMLDLPREHAFPDRLPLTWNAVQRDAASRISELLESVPDRSLAILAHGLVACCLPGPRTIFLPDAKGARACCEIAALALDGCVAAPGPWLCSASLSRKLQQLGGVRLVWLQRHVQMPYSSPDADHVVHLLAACREKREAVHSLLGFLKRLAASCFASQINGEKRGLDRIPRLIWIPAAVGVATFVLVLGLLEFIGRTLGAP